MTSGFATRLRATIERRGALCVGIDPHAPLLAQWGLADDASGVREFGLRVVEAATGRVGVVKPQVAFFERHGSAGFAVLEEVLAAARAAELLVIADAKRGDVGSTADAYGEAWLTPGAPLEADAMTAVAYQGFGSLDGVLARAEAVDKGVFVLAATSNPESTEIQAVRSEAGETIAASIVRQTSERSGTAGVVVGATVAFAQLGLSAEQLTGLSILAPGFGVQGAVLADGPALFGSALPGVLASVSRSILSAGPDGIVDAITAANAEVTGWQK